MKDKYSRHGLIKLVMKEPECHLPMYIMCVYTYSRFIFKNFLSSNIPRKYIYI